MVYGFEHNENGSGDMKKQTQERPGTWRLLIVSAVVLCAQAVIATADNLSFPLDTIGRFTVVAGEPQELLVRFADCDDLPASCPDLAGPRTKASIRRAICERLVPGATVQRQYERAQPGLVLVKLPKGTSALVATLKFLACSDVVYAEPNYRYRFCAEALSLIHI